MTCLIFGATVVKKSSLPVMELTEKEFAALGEYSTSIPTGPRPGRRWKCHRPKLGLWFMGEAYELPADDPYASTDVGIRWYEIKVTP